MSTAADRVISGRVRQADGAYERGSVWIAGERISAVTAGAPTPAELQGAQHVDVGDAFVLPGAIDASNWMRPRSSSR